MAVTDPLVMPLAQELLACLAQEIEKVENPPAYIGLRVGDVVGASLSQFEDEACSGVAWVRPVTFVPSSGTFPAQDDTPSVAGTLAWAVTLEMGVIRCAPTPPASQIITSEQWETLAQEVMDDAAAMRRALCCFGELARNRMKNMLPGSWDPIAVEGGAAGGTLTVTVRGPACDCSDAGPES